MLGSQGKGKTSGDGDIKVIKELAKIKVSERLSFGRIERFGNLESLVGIALELLHLISKNWQARELLAGGGCGEDALGVDPDELAKVLEEYVHAMRVDQLEGRGLC